MKKRFAYYMSVLLAIAGIMSSCIKDDYPATDKATVTMTFSTRAEPQEGAESDLLPNEEMRTLRVIVARSGGNVVYNVMSDIAPEETSKTIPFDELTVNKDGEDFDFYAIANEKGLHFQDGLGIDLENIKTDEQLQQLKETGIVVELPKEGELIPQTAFTTIHVVPGMEDNSTMKLDFAVAKLTLTVTNETNEEQTISGIEWGNMNTSTSSVFSQDPLPFNVLSTTKMNNITVLAGETKSQSVYVFENQPSQGYPYTFSAQWNGEQTANLSSIKNLKRGTHVMIKVSLKGTTINDCILISEVLPWGVKDLGPTFE